jgi:tetratricopeptide (TPR) repeat protein
MKAQYSLIKNSTLLLLALLLINGCGSSGPKESTLLSKKRRMGSVSDIGQNELAGDLEARLARSSVYTQNNTLLSVLNNDSVKEKCEFNSEKDYKDWGRMLRIGFACVNKNDWKMVYQIGQSFSVRHIDAPWGAYFLSLVSEKSGDMPRAIWMIGLADRKSPNNAVIEFQKARLLWLQDQKDAAFQSAKKALDLDPKLSEAALLMAQVYFSDYEFESAQSYYRKVIDSNDKVFTAVLGMAESFAQLDKYKESIPFYIRAIKLKKNRIDLAYVLADIFETKVKDYKRALSWYEKISGVFPSEVVSKEKTEVQNKIAFLNNKIEEQKNSGKSQQASKTVEKRIPAATSVDDEAQLSTGEESNAQGSDGSAAPSAQEQERGGQ